MSSASAALLGKDLAEHGRALLGIVLACGALVLLALAQNRAAAFGMSPFEVVRFALITFLPLICLIVGNRLIVREYLSGTRRFVEALPVGPVWPLVLKWLIGFVFVAMLGLAVIALCAAGATLADDPSRDYLVLLGAKTLTVLLLYWSVVFCFSLCGHLRIVLYLVAIGTVLALLWMPGLDASRFAPIGLLDRELFVFERDLVPLREIGWTLALAAAFTLAGFTIARLGDGSVAERLARPMSRRDYVVFGVLLAGGAALAGAVAENRTREAVSFGGDGVLRIAQPELELYYGSAGYLDAAERFAGAVARAVVPLESALGLESLPVLRLALRPTRERHDIDYGTLDGVYVAANWLEHDSYDDAVLVAVVLHGVLTARTGGRAPFEPYHWVLDGFTRWWAETGSAAGAQSWRLPREHRDELLARAALVASRLGPDDDLIDTWQTIADRFGYPGAEALATVAFERIAGTAGRDAAMALAREFLALPLADNTLASITDRKRGPRLRFQKATGLEWSAFQQGLFDQLREVAREGTPLLDVVPPLSAVARSSASDGVPVIEAGFEAFVSAAGPGSVDAAGDDTPECYLHHTTLSPFASEWDVDDEDGLVAPCAADPALFELRGRYAPGDRAYLALGFESDAFHQPVRLGIVRLDVRAPAN